MLNSEHFKELEKDKCLFITRGFPENEIIDPSNVVGRVNSLDIENGISNISINKEIYKEMYLHHERYNNMTLGMNYLGTVDNYEVSYMKILSFSLIDNKGNFLLE